MQWLVNRMTEGDSHAGLAAIMQALKIFLPQYAAVFDGATMLFGALAVVIKQKGSTS